MENIDFNGAGDEARYINNIDTYLRLSNCHYISNVTNKAEAIYANLGSVVAFYNNHIFDHDDVYAQLCTSDIILPANPPHNLLRTKTNWKVTEIGTDKPTTFYIKDIVTEGYYRTISGNTCLDAPANYQSRSFRLNVKTIYDARIYELIPTGSNKLYIGVISGTQENIKWKAVIE